jgi:hypothetical protein
VLELRGDQFSTLNLIGSEQKEKSIFDGLDTSIVGAAKRTNNSEEPNRQRLEELQAVAADALREFDARTPDKILPHLAKGYALAVKGEWSTRLPGTKAFFRDKQKEFADAIRLAAGIQLDALADRETIVPGETTSISVRTFLPIKEGIKGTDIKLVAGNWTISRPSHATVTTAGFGVRPATSGNFNVTVPTTEMLSPTG